MVDFANSNELNKVNPWPLPFQWFGFYASGKLYSMMSSEDHDYTSKKLNEIFESLPGKKMPNYKLTGQFLIVDNPQMKNYQEVWGVNLFSQDINEQIKKGYLIMTLDDVSGNVAYYRLLKRIE